MKTLRGTPKHLSQANQLDGFAYLMFNLPFTCNYHCRKCFNCGISCAQMPAKIPITLADTLRIISDAASLGGRAVVMAGEGEPTLHPDIRTIIRAIHGLNMIPIVYSNGSTLTEKVATFYCDHGVSLVIALDSLRQPVYDFLTGTRRMLPKVLNNIAGVRRLYGSTVEEKDGLRILRVAVNATVMDRNTDEIRSIKEFCGQDVYFVCNPLAQLGNAVGNWAGLMPGNDPTAHAALIRELSETGGPLTLDRTGVCGYSANGISISPTGEYMSCAYTRDTNGLLGNVRTMPLAEAWERKHALEFAHYRRYGYPPCLVRDSSFPMFVESLR